MAILDLPASYTDSTTTYTGAQIGRVHKVLEGQAFAALEVLESTAGGVGIVEGFEVTDGGGLDVSISAGLAIVNHSTKGVMALKTTAPATVTGLTDDATNYIFALAEISTNDSRETMLPAFVAQLGSSNVNGVRLATVVTASGAIDTITADAPLTLVGTGDTTGPASSTDNAITRFDSTTGKLLQNSAVTIDDDGALTVPEISAPATPDAGKVVIYAKADGAVYAKDDAGTETALGVAGAGTGDMLASTYDPNNDGVIALAQGGTGATSASGARTSLGLGSIATQAASGVAITGGTIAGITDLAIADGGTGASTAAAARTALGVPAIAHTHAQADVTDLVTDLAAKADVTHAHAASDITSGTIDQARLGTGSGGAGAKFLADDQTYKAPSTVVAAPVVVAQAGSGPYTFSPNLADGDHFEMALANDATMNAPSGTPVSGKVYVFDFHISGNTLTLPGTFIFPDGVTFDGAPGASKRLRIVAMYDDTSFGGTVAYGAAKWMCSAPEVFSR